MDLDEYHRLVGAFRASGLTEAQAHAKAEEVMDKWNVQNLCESKGETDYA